MTPPPVALDHPGTARTLRATLRWGLGWLVVAVVGLALVIGVEGGAAERQSALERDGVSVLGVVVDARTAVRGPDRVTYRYTFDGEEHRGSIVGSGSYVVGTPVTVIVDPDRPDRSTLAGEQAQGAVGFWASTIGGVAALGGLVAGPAVLVQWWRRRRVVRAAPWEEHSVQLVTGARGGLRLVDEADGSELHLTKDQRSRLGLSSGDTHRLRVALVGDRAVVSTLDEDQVALARRHPRP